MRVYRATYTARAPDGTTVRRTSRNFTIEFTDHQGVQRRVTAFPASMGKGRSESLANRITRLVAHRAAHDPLEPDLIRWVNDMAPDLRQKLIGWRILDPERSARHETLRGSLKHYYRHMRAKGNDPRYIRQAARYILRAAKACGFRCWGDVQATAYAAYLTALGSGRKALSAPTRNRHLAALKGFCAWAADIQKILPVSPVRHLRPLPVMEEEARWPFSPEEMRLLLRKTSIAPRRWGMSGPERALLYRVAVETGYRAGECASLTRASFELDSAHPTVRLLARSAKAKRGGLPLRPDTVALLREHLKAKAPAAPAFDMPDSTHTAEMIRADLRDAGIAITDAFGRKRDFHTLRHTTGTWLANAGVHPKLVQTIMRHSTIRLTMDRYVHADRDQASEALTKLPTLAARRKSGSG